MNKNKMIEVLMSIRKDDKDTIDKLICLNERLMFQIKDVISEFEKYLKTQNKEK